MTKPDFDPWAECWPGTDIPITLFSPEEWDEASERVIDEDFDVEGERHRQCLMCFHTIVDCQCPNPGDHEG
jgi:hypothetical protein